MIYSDVQNKINWESFYNVSLYIPLKNYFDSEARINESIWAILKSYRSYLI